MDVFSHRHYRDVLQFELARRMKQNPRYSQGAFARDLALTPSRLSEILHGKQGVSSQVGLQMARQLRCNEAETKYFLDLVESQNGRSRLLREAARLRLLRYRRPSFIELLGEDAYSLLNDWYNFAILELLRCGQSSRDANWFREQLDISLDQAKEALLRLERLGLTQVNSEGQVELVELNNRFIGSEQSETFQNFCRQILSKAMAAVDQDRPHAMQTSMIAVAEKNLPELLDCMRESCNKLAEKLDVKAESKDVVYCFTAQFFPVSGQASFSNSPSLH